MSFEQFVYAYGAPNLSAAFRSEPEDFIVDEQYSQPFSGEGEHFWLNIKKTGENTDWVAGKLAEYFSVKRNDVGYSGKKDRHAVTTQWFSVYLPGRAHTIDWPQFLAMSGLRADLLASYTHSKKLKIGQHESNQFRITLRNISLDDALETRLDAIRDTGVPNYFGEQRFGRDFGNIERVKQWVAAPEKRLKRSQQGMIYSSARSFLFNRVLSARVQQANWLELLDGEPMNTSTGPLWGRGRNSAERALLAFENGVLSPYAKWCEALEHVGLSQERRALVLKPEDFSYSAKGDILRINMTLGAGQYATSILREIAKLDNAVHKKEER
jgi:tRNA pseudouridine13 synthase